MRVDLCQGARLTASVVHAIRERATGRGRMKAQVSQWIGDTRGRLNTACKVEWLAVLLVAHVVIQADQHGLVCLGYHMHCLHHKQL
jgi:hypothetical protein